jgi:glucose/arabinose dehydrogenase
MSVAMIVGVAPRMVAAQGPVPSAAAQGPAYPPGPRVVLTEVASAAQPIGVTGRPGDPATLYVIEKAGRIRTVRGANWGPTLLDIRARVSTSNERGLFALAFNPATDRAYVTYAALDGAFTLSEFPVDGDVADASAERVLLRVAHPNDDHYGGALLWITDRVSTSGAPGGLLMVGVGDGGGVGTRGGVGDRANNAQNLSVLLGKVLRIDPTPASASTSSGPYSIPASNPFARGVVTGVSTSSGSAVPARPEIWAFGVRNPWRMTIGPDDSLWLADVGQSSWEEINRVPLSKGGINFGWRLREGTKPYRGGRKPAGAMDPVFEFAHDNGRCAVIGGAVGGPRVGVVGLEGKYVFGDVCTGRLAAFDPARPIASAVDLGARTAYLTFVGSGPDGRLYATSINGGVYRIDPA